MFFDFISIINLLLAAEYPANVLKSAKNLSNRAIFAITITMSHTRAAALWPEIVRRREKIDGNNGFGDSIAPLQYYSVIGDGS